jgi:hypothetical protein
MALLLVFGSKVSEQRPDLSQHQAVRLAQVHKQAILGIRLIRKPQSM